MSMLRLNALRTFTGNRFRAVKKSERIVTNIECDKCDDSRFYPLFVPHVREFSSTLTTRRTLKLDSNNVLSSSFSDVTGFEGVLLHEYVWASIDKWPDKTAVVCPTSGKSYTYAELRQLCGKLATSLRRCNLRPGDTVAIILPNVPEFIISFMAACEAGLRVTPINPIYTAEEITRQMLNADVKAVIALSSKYETLRRCVKEKWRNDADLPIIVIKNEEGAVTPPGTIKFEDLVKDDVKEFWKHERTSRNSQDDVILPYSSGTTGMPKGVQLSHRNVVVNLCQISHKDVFTYIETTDTYQDVVPLILPLFHMYGLALIMLNYLRYGSKLVCMPQFSMQEFIKILDNYQVTMLYVVPPMLQMMAHEERLKPRHTDSVRHIVCGAASLGEESISLLRKRLTSPFGLTQGYGMTEASPVVTFSIDAPSHSAGYLVPNTQMRIVGYSNDNAGRNLGIKETGEIYVRGPQVMKGYYKNPEATADTMDGDWLKTGDLGYVDEEGTLYVEGRLKELIKVKGYQVAPAELEEIIRGFDKVEDIAVIGVPHEKYGEIPKAFVVPKRGTKINEDEIKDFVAERVAKYKRLGHVQFIDKIPKSLSGKILRKELQ